MTAEPADELMTYYFSKLQIEAGLWFVAMTKMGPFMVSVIYLDFPTLRPLSEEAINVKKLIVEAND